MPKRKMWPPRLYDYKGYARAKDPNTGQYKSFGPTGPDAQRAYLEWLATLDRPDEIQISPADRTVGTVLDLWFAAQSLHPKEFKNYLVTIRDLKASHGHLSARLFKVPQLRAYRTSLLPRMSAKTANHRVTRVRVIWRWLEEEGYVPEGSWEHLRALKPLRTEERKPRAVTWEELQMVLPHCREDVRSMLLVQFWTGMRPGEVRIIRGQDIQDGIYTPETHKNAWRGHSRQIILPPEAQEALRPFLVDGRLFGRSEIGYAKAVARAAKKAGVRMTAYSVRHGFKDRLLHSGASLDEVRAAMGHKSLGTTNDYGTQADLELARRAIAKGDKDRL